MYNQILEFLTLLKSENRKGKTKRKTFLENL